jgi:hypothetical protein
MGKNISHDTLVSNDMLRIAALRKYVTDPKLQIPSGDGLLTPSEILAQFQTSLDQHAAVNAARAAYKAALAARDAMAAKHRVFDEALKYWVLFSFGPESTQAREFGYALRKPPQMTAEARALAVARNKATREKRGTMGKRERLKIKGTLPAPPDAPDPESSPAPLPVHGSD